MTLKQFLENCAYCGSTVELIIGPDDEHGTTYSISCKPCRNFSGEHIGIFGEQSSIDSWNEQQRRFKKYAVLKEPKL